MKRRLLSGIILLSLSISIFTAAFNIQQVNADGTIYIRANGSIDPPTAPILTFDNVTYTLTGIIYGSIVIERSDIIVNGDGHIVEGTGTNSETGIVVSSAINVTVKNIHIRNFLRGIIIDRFSRNIILFGNVIENADFGIELSSTNNNVISANSIETNKASLWGYGIYLYESSNNYIIGNSIYNNNEGIILQHSWYNNIFMNSIVGNNYGIELGFGTYYGSDYNSIIGNNIINNGVGLRLVDSSSNYIYHNNFINNTNHAESPTFSNIWDNGYPEGGNYWDNYNGTDLYKGPNQDLPGSDGIGDKEYSVDYQNTDRYPLMRPWSPIPPYKFKISEVIRVTDDLNVRTGPGLSYTVSATMLKGNKGLILSGPINNDGYKWWKVHYDVGVTGWSAENWLEQAPSPPQAPFDFGSWAEAAISWAQQRIGSEKWWNYCLRFVANAFMREEDKPAGWNSPLDAARDYAHFDRQDQMPYGWRLAPRGAIIFFDKNGPNPYGHVGIYLGNGSIIHAYGIVKVSTIEEALGKPDIGQYLGWSYPPEVWRSASIENQPPIADAGQDLSALSGELITFNASGSYDPDGTIISYRWNFGDGTTAEGRIVSHRFKGAQNQAKTYTVELTVEDDKGATNTDTMYATITPLEKVVEVSSSSAYAKMKVSYNWIEQSDSGEVYIISKIEVEGGGFVGVFVPTIWTWGSIYPLEAEIPTFEFLDYLFATGGETGRTYPPYNTKPVIGISPSTITRTFSDGSFSGIQVKASDMMSIYLQGVTLKLGWPPIGVELFEFSLIPFDPHVSSIEPNLLQKLLDKLLEKLPKLTIGKLGSPCELRIYDSQGRITGLIEGQVMEEIPNSAYFNNTFILFSSNDPYTYEIKGLENGFYKLLIAHFIQNKSIVFTATDIPISPDAIHQFILDWGSLSQNQHGATIRVDLNNDGTFEKTFTSDKELTQDEFISQIRPAENFQLWIIGAVTAIMVIVTAIVVLRRRHRRPAKT